MKIRSILVSLALLFATAAFAQGPRSSGGATASPSLINENGDNPSSPQSAKNAARKPAARADIINAKGEKIGTATFWAEKGGVGIHVDVSHLPPGTHGFHIHAVGACDPPDFKTAGAHLNPDNKQHGSKNPAGPHAGDLQNLEVGADGIGSAKVVANQVTLGDGMNSLFHPGGTSIVIHEKADDYMTDPSGNSGARIACGVIKK